MADIIQLPSRRHTYGDSTPCVEVTLPKRPTLGFHCRTCGKGIADGVSLFRINPKGEPGVWACRKHCDAVPLDEVVDHIVSVIEKGNRHD